LAGGSEGLLICAGAVVIEKDEDRAVTIAAADEEEIRGGGGGEDEDNPDAAAISSRFESRMLFLEPDSDDWVNAPSAARSLEGSASINVGVVADDAVDIELSPPLLTRVAFNDPVSPADSSLEPCASCVVSVVAPGFFLAAAAPFLVAMTRTDLSTGVSPAPVFGSFG
jgi:hypothetical protein